MVSNLFFFISNCAKVKTFFLSYHPTFFLSYHPKFSHKKSWCDTSYHILYTGQYISLMYQVMKNTQWQFISILCPYHAASPDTNCLPYENELWSNATRISNQANMAKNYLWNFRVPVYLLSLFQCLRCISKCSSSPISHKFS